MIPSITTLSTLALLLFVGTQPITSTPQAGSPGKKSERSKPAAEASLRLPKTKVPVFWILGQSNAGGATPGFWLANPLIKENKWPHLAKQSNVKVWWPGKTKFRPNSVAGWESYVTGSVKPDNNSSSWINELAFGPEASLGEAAAKHFGRDVYLFKVTGVGGLSNMPNLTTWSKQPGSYYERALTQWKLASAAMIKQGLLPDVKAVFWIQGESDGGQAKAYEGLLKQFIADMRKDIKASIPRKLRRKLRSPFPLPFVISQLHDQHLSRTWWAPIEVILRTAQLRVAESDRYALLCTTETLVVPQTGHAVHYDAVSQVKHGFILFDTLKRALGKKLR